MINRAEKFVTHKKFLLCEIFANEIVGKFNASKDWKLRRRKVLKLVGRRFLDVSGRLNKIWTPKSFSGSASFR